MNRHAMLVIGKGFWGPRWIEAVEAEPDVALAGVVTRDYADVLARSEADMVAVVTPPATHLAIVQAALAAGKHVVCEKPLADTWASALAIARLVRSRPQQKQKFMVAQTRRFVPQVETVRRFLAAGRLGQVSTIKFDHTVHDPDGGWRLELFSPVLDDMATHHFDAFRYMTGAEPLDLYAEGWNPPWSRYPANGCHNVLIRMTGDIHVNYFATWSANGRQNSYDGQMQMIGERGSLELAAPDRLLFYEGRTEPETSPPPRPVPMVELDRTEVGAALRAFVDAIDRDTPPPCDIDDNLNTIAMACAAVESCRTATRVDVQRMLQEAAMG